MFALGGGVAGLFGLWFRCLCLGLVVMPFDYCLAVVIVVAGLRLLMLRFGLVWVGLGVLLWDLVAVLIVVMVFVLGWFVLELFVIVGVGVWLAWCGCWIWCLIWVLVCMWLG